MEKIQQVSDTTKNTKLYVLESGKCYEAKKKKSDAGQKKFRTMGRGDVGAHCKKYETVVRVGLLEKMRTKQRLGGNYMGQIHGECYQGMCLECSKSSRKPAWLLEKISCSLRPLITIS